MASVVNKSLCATCNNERGIFKCDGCSQMFCLRHTTTHHVEIVKQLDAVEKDRDFVQRTLLNELSEPCHDLEELHDELMKKIDDWEKESISKIQNAAAEARNDLNKCTIGRSSTKQHELETLNSVIQQARRKTDFNETDLSEWTEKLNQLKEELMNVSKIVVVEDQTKLISNIRVHLFTNKESFERSSGNTKFEENGKVVYVKKGTDPYTEVRGKCDYMTGQHTIVMKVEQLNGWILFGIISKSTQLTVHSYASCSCYGWYNGSNFNYSGGRSIDGEGSDVLANDTIQLIIDCDNRLIRLINDRTGQKLELNVDINQCPFPWQLHLNLNTPPTRIRIIS